MAGFSIISIGMIIAIIVLYFAEKNHNRKNK